MADALVSLSDAEIVQRVRAGDRDVFGALFRTYWVPLCTFVTAMTRDGDAAREVVADLFAALWERRDALAVTGSLEAYLFVAARNRVRTMHRDVQRRQELLVAHEADGVVMHPDAVVMDEGDIVDVRLSMAQAMAEMPERYRAAIYLRWERDLEYDRIGEMLELSPAAAKKLVQRATVMLRERLRRA